MKVLLLIAVILLPGVAWGYSCTTRSDGTSDCAEKRQIYEAEQREAERWRDDQMKQMEDRRRDSEQEDRFRKLENDD